MLRAVRLYGSEKEFADMMMRRLEEELNVKLRQDEEEPLLLFGRAADSDEGEDQFYISLHHAYQEYVHTGDLNSAVDFLNEYIQTAQEMMSQGLDDWKRIDLSRVYPALRDRNYVELPGNDDCLRDEVIPGIYVVYLEMFDRIGKLIHRPLLDEELGQTEEKIREAAYRNLHEAGWTGPKMSLPCPPRRSCTLDVYMDNEFPIEYQFLDDELASANLPESCLLAFPNRNTSLVLCSWEPMRTAAQALKLAKESKFHELVTRSYYMMPYPNSLNIYWRRSGKVTLLKVEQRCSKGGDGSDNRPG